MKIDLSFNSTFIGFLKSLILKGTKKGSMTFAESQLKTERTYTHRDCGLNRMEQCLAEAWRHVREKEGQLVESVRTAILCHGQQEHPTPILKMLFLYGLTSYSFSQPAGTHSVCVCVCPLPPGRMCQPSKRSHSPKQRWRSSHRFFSRKLLLGRCDLSAGKPDGTEMPGRRSGGLKRA